jgi:hypothetical protein
MTNAQGVDISVWQNQRSTPQMFDPYKARAKGASFAGIKVSQANWADPDYALNWAHCKGVLYRMPYHFLTWDVSSYKQAETFWSLIERDTYGLLPLTCDFEWWKTVPTQAMDMLYTFTYRLKQLADPLPEAIYSAFSFWRQYGSLADYWKQFHLWLCDIEGEVQVPKPWANWDFHQYTFKLNGPDWGAESADLDGDRYNGTLEQMMTRFHLPALEGMPDQPQGQYPRMRVNTRVLNVRSGPGKDYPDLGDLHQGDIVDLLRIGGQNAWVEFAPGKWCCAALDNEQYLIPCVEVE